MKFSSLKRLFTFLFFICINTLLCQTTISNEELIGKGQPEFFGKDHKLRKEAHEAFLKMKGEALKEGIKIGFVSSYRSFNHQKRIWERKFNRNKSLGLTDEENIKKIIEYSTIPGTSRHHWGTDIDIIDLNVKQPKSSLQPNNYHGNGAFCKLKNWMNIHANRFGFYLVYTNNGNRKGFKYEPWHYSYEPLSSFYLKKYKAIDLSVLIKKEQLSGRKSFSKTFIENYLKEHILDINPKLL